MPKRKSSNTSYVPPTKRNYRKRTKYVRPRRRGAARPMRALSTGYRGTPNNYRFSRETAPVVVDLGKGTPWTTPPVASDPGVLIIPGVVPADTSICMFKVPPLDFAKLPNATEFSALFNNYKVDKIETFLVPMWEQTVNPDYATSGTNAIPNLMITRVNTKYLVSGLAASATAEGQRSALAEIMKKSRSLYGNKKWLKLTTMHPMVPTSISDGAGGTNTIIEPASWVQFNTGADQRWQQNDVFFADRLDGEALVPGIYKYRMYQKVHFRTSFVG